jgi:membrane fusion protein (multidrug efflux system)
MRRRSVLIVVVFSVLAFLTVGLAVLQFVVKPQMIKGFITKAPPPVATVAVAEPRREEWTPRIPAIGTIRAVQGIDVAPQIGGVIRAFHFDSGQDVEKGRLLIQLDDAVEQADLKANLATLRNAELALERQSQLITGGSTTRSTLDATQAQRDAAAAAVERSRALIAQKAISAPFSGRIGLRRGDIGQYVSPGTAITTLQQLDPVFVDFPVPEQNIADLKIGLNVEVTIDALGDRVFNGVIVSLDARVSPETRNLLVRAQIDNEDKSLRPGMFANVAVMASKSAEVFTLPRTAVTFSLYGDSVYVVKPQEAQPGSAQASTNDRVMVVERKPVRVGETRGSRMAILSGINAEDQVVTEGQLKLMNGARVRVDNTLALPTPPNPLPRQ